MPWSDSMGSILHPSDSEVKMCLALDTLGADDASVMPYYIIKEEQSE